MITPLIFIAIGVGALLLIIYLFRGNRTSEKSFDDVVEQLQPIDVNAFRNLIDEKEEDYLRAQLETSEFRSIHRERMLAAVEYVWGAARNAGILIHLAEAVQHDPDPAVASAALSLLENASKLRLYALRVVPQLWLSMLIPGLRLTPLSVAESYDAVAREVVILGCLRSSSRKVSTVYS